MPPIEPITIDTPRGRFGARALGPADAPLVVCLHGFPDDAGTFDDLLPRLATAGFRAVAPYLRGYAPSPLEGPYGMGDLAQDLLAVGDALSPREVFRVVGHDIGSQAAYRACADAPDRIAGAVTLAGPHPTPMMENVKRSPAQMWRSRYIALFQIPRYAEWLVRRNDYAYLDALWRRWSPGFTPPPERMAAVRRTFAASMPAPVLMYRDGDFAGDARPVRAPTLFLAGADDGCIAPAMADGQERLFTGPYAHEIVPRAGHFLHLKQPEPVGRRIVEWLVASEPPRSRAAPAQPIP